MPTEIDIIDQVCSIAYTDKQTSSIKCVISPTETDIIDQLCNIAYRDKQTSSIMCVILPTEINRHHRSSVPVHSCVHGRQRQHSYKGTKKSLCTELEKKREGEHDQKNNEAMDKDKRKLKKAGRL